MRNLNIFFENFLLQVLTVFGKVVILDLSEMGIRAPVVFPRVFERFLFPACRWRPRLLRRHSDFIVVQIQHKGMVFARLRVERYGASFDGHYSPVLSPTGRFLA
jgi:hypothetical protein